MTLFVVFSLFLHNPAWAKSDTLLEEIRLNLEDSRQKLEQTQKQILELEQNDEKLRRNIKEYDSELQKKQDEQRKAKDNLNEYNQKLLGTSSAKKEFERALMKDKQEMEMVQADLIAVEKKLGQLKAAKNALKESIEISEENLTTMNDRSSTWQKNRDQVQSELSGIEKDISQIDVKKDAQEKFRIDNQQALNKWKKSLATQEAVYQKYDVKYRQALHDAEKKK